MDARFNYTSQLTADHRADLHRAATVHRLRRAAATPAVDSAEHAVRVPRRSWWLALRGNRTAQPTVMSLDAG
ncbi:MAG: hypothetical protein QOG30_3010 [Acidimicrobiaceae bacterium]|jgi:hypothetical protein